MGDVGKVWLREANDQTWLFKANRVGRSVDEAASEFAASRIASLLAVPAAQVVLARRNDELGALCMNLIDNSETLVEGQALLSSLVSDFDPKDSKSRGHRPGFIEEILRDCRAPSIGLPSTTSIELFSLYLFFDALIGNTDRHSGNWAIISNLIDPDLLAPSYDHATSLGVTTRSNKRKDLIESDEALRDFVVKGRASRFEDGQKVDLLSYALHFSQTYAPRAANAWKLRIERLLPVSLARIIDSSGFTLDGGKLAKRVIVENLRRAKACLQ